MRGGTLTERVLALPWVADGIAPEWDGESEELARFDLLASYDGAVARRIAGYAWVVDGIETEEEALLREFVTIARVDVGLAGRIVAYAWVVDGITDTERYALGALRTLIVEAAGETQHLTDADRLGLDELTGASWLVDGVTEAEWRRLDELYEDARAQRVAQR